MFRNVTVSKVLSHFYRNYTWILTPINEAIMAISPISLFMYDISSYKYDSGILGAKKEEDKPEDASAKIIEKKLKDLGYSSTGNVDADKLLLTTILRTVGNEAIGSGESQSLPWQHVLDELKLTSLGNREDDYNLIMTTLDEIIKGMANESDKKYYLDLAQEAENAFSNQAQNSLSDFGSMAGATYSAQLNKFFML